MNISMYENMYLYMYTCMYVYHICRNFRCANFHGFVAGLSMKIIAQRIAQIGTSPISIYNCHSFKYISYICTFKHVASTPSACDVFLEVSTFSYSSILSLLIDKKGSQVV